MRNEIGSPTVLVAGSEPFELATLAASLRLNSINVVAEASSASTAENLYRCLTPDVAVIDLQFAGHDVLALTNNFRNMNPLLGIVLMTASPDLRLLGVTDDLIPQGAQIVHKKSAADLAVMKRAIEHSLTAVGGAEKKSWINTHGSHHENSFKSILDEFTDIQMATLRLVARGLTNSEIAKVRFVSEKSVEQIVSRIAQHFQLETDKTRNQRVVIAGEYFKWIGAAAL
jgi:DNA-binding NarL/FixJ family response regulator